MRLFVFAALAVSIYAQTSDSAKCSGTPKPFSPGSGDWNGWGVDAQGSRFQPQPGLTAADVPKLKLKWAFAFPGPANQRNQAQPVIVGGRVFVGSAAGIVFALDAATGCTYWSYDAGNITRTAIQIVKPQGETRWIAYFGDSGGTTHAVDAVTGQLVWKTKVDDFPLARITGSPVYFDGRLYVPMSSGEELGSGAAKYECCKFRGSLSALDARTGKVIWKTYTIPDPAKAYKTLPDGTKLWGPAGGSIWSAPIIDAKRKRIYAGTGNSYTAIEMPTTDAIVAFDLESGSLLWSNQVTPGDNWIPGCPRSAMCPENPGDDYDFGSSNVMRTVNGRDVILASQKSGVVYALDPEQRGKVLWKTRLGVGNGLMGGIGWGMAAEGNTVYAAIADINKPDGTPGLYALNAATGDKIWSTPAPQNAGNRAQAAAVSAMPGIAFSASFGGHLRAYSTRNGEIVWDFDAVKNYETVNGIAGKGGAFNGGGPAIANGMVIATSGYGFAGGQGGNVLLAFSVDGK
jgi:polyvinyl alcohol dehydrogenase (cytochrome)